MNTQSIDKLIAEMPIERKIGQMFMGNICGGESLDTARRQFEQFGFGGVQFSGVFERFVRGGDYLPCGVDRNKPLAETARFLHEVHRASLDVLGLPVIVGGDQEGGIASSILRRRNISLLPSQMGLGATGSVELAERVAEVSAREVKAVGLDMLYGPSCDINTNPDNPEIGQRSFGDDPETVARFAEAVVRAYSRVGIIATAKHFPGRGHGASNAHHELESIALDRSRLESVELLPFRRAIAAGADSVMMAHTVYPALDDSGTPASLSRRIVTDVLRGELGFDGLIIPDTLTMFAISRNFEVPDAAAMCIEAGADMIFMKVPDLYAPCIEAILGAVRAGRISEEQIDASVRRVLTLKLKRGLFELPEFDESVVDKSVGTADNVAAVTEAARHCLTVVRNRDGFLPQPDLAGKTVLAVVPRDMNVAIANDPVLSHDMLARSLGRFINDVRLVIVDETPTVPQSFEAVGRAKNADVIVFGIYSAGASPEQLKLLGELVELGKPVVVVVTGSPYVVTRLPEHVKAVLCTFGITPYVFDAAAEMLLGKRTAEGRLPVTVSDRMPKGFAAL